MSSSTTTREKGAHTKIISHRLRHHTEACKIKYNASKTSVAIIFHSTRRLITNEEFRVRKTKKISRRAINIGGQWCCWAGKNKKITAFSPSYGLYLEYLSSIDAWPPQLQPHTLVSDPITSIGEVDFL